MTELEQARAIISEADREMAKVFEKRMAAVRTVAAYKKANGLPITDRSREEEMLREEAGLIEDESLRPFYVSFLRETIGISKSYQHRLMDGMRVAYSGVEGAFANIAAEKIFPDATCVAHADFAAAYRAVAEGTCDCAVLPIENSQNGDVGRVLDLAYFGKLYVSGVYEVEIVHNLLAVKGTTMDEVRTSPLIKEGQTAEDVFTFNNFGYIVRKDLIGTANEAHMYVLDEKGSNKQVYRGNMLPKYNMNLTNTFAWKNFLFYFTMSYQQGGLLYNNTLMYMAFAGHNAAYWDMSGRDWSQRKPASYVGQYPRNTIIEDITFLKLRELALNYTFTESQLKRIGIGVVKGIKLGIIGRNLFTLTNFNGPDPETNTVEEGILGGVDTPKYPSDIRTFSGTLTIDF